MDIKGSARARSYYEKQGEEALRRGRELECSGRTTVDAVIRMTNDYQDEFKTVLDVGCGSNLRYDIALAELGKQVSCVDFTASFLTMAPRDERLLLLQGDATQLPVRSGFFDAVICSETIEHVPNPEQVVLELARVLRPGGILFATVPNLWNASRLINMVKKRSFAVNLMEGHIKEYSPRELRQLLSAGFRVERTYPVGFGWTGKFGRWIELLIRTGLLRRLSISVAMVARRRS